VPIYEFRCRDCGRKSAFFTRSASAALDPRCKKCGSANLEKLVSRVAVRRSSSREMGEGLGEDFERDVDRAPDEDLNGEAGEEEGGGFEDEG